MAKPQMDISDHTAPTAESNSRAASVRLQHYTKARAKFQIDHDFRRGPQPAYVDGGRSHLNTQIGGELGVADYAALMLERRELTNPQRAADMTRAAVMTAGIVTFGHDAQRWVEALPGAEQDAMLEAIAEAVAKELGNDVTGIGVHRDETAIHAHFEMPARRADGRLMSEVLSPAMTSKLQDIACETAQKWVPEIERGEKKAKTKARNKSVAQLHRTELADLAKKIERRTADVAALEEKIRKNEDLAEKARAKAEADESRAAKALKNVETYERRATEARAALEKLLADTKELLEAHNQLISSSDQLTAKIHQQKSELETVAGAVAQKKTKIDSLRARLRALSAA